MRMADVFERRLAERQGGDQPKLRPRDKMAIIGLPRATVDPLIQFDVFNMNTWPHRWYDDFDGFVTKLSLHFGIRRDTPPVFLGTFNTLLAVLRRCVPEEGELLEADLNTIEPALNQLRFEYERTFRRVDVDAAARAIQGSDPLTREFDKHRRGRSPGRGGGRTSSKGRTVRCFNCGKTGHVRKDCRQGQGNGAGGAMQN
jgi:hypothetical protein